MTPKPTPSKGDIRVGVGVCSKCQTAHPEAFDCSLNVRFDPPSTANALPDALLREGAFVGAAYGHPDLYHKDGEMLGEMYLAMRAHDPAFKEAARVKADAPIAGELEGLDKTPTGAFGLPKWQYELRAASAVLEVVDKPLGDDFRRLLSDMLGRHQTAIASLQADNALRGGQLTQIGEIVGDRNADPVDRLYRIRDVLNPEQGARP